MKGRDKWRTYERIVRGWLKEERAEERKRSYGGNRWVFRAE